MSLVVEDGTGLATAESYISVADADTYLAAHGNPSAWSSSTTAQKEEALRLATQYLDIRFGRRFLGYRKTEAQALAWPRCGAWDFDGYAIDDDSVPGRLEDATAELALRSRSADLMPDVETPGSIVRERVKVGSIEEEIEYAGGKGQWPRFRKVDAILSVLLGSSASEISMERG